MAAAAAAAAAGYDDVAVAAAAAAGYDEESLGMMRKTASLQVCYIVTCCCYCVVADGWYLSKLHIKAVHGANVDSCNKSDPVASHISQHLLNLLVDCQPSSLLTS
jgi:hypothetical protein